MFKLLALCVLDGCADHIKKCLQPNVYYYFCTDYRFEVKDRVYKGSRYSNPIHDEFFTPVQPIQFGEKKTYSPTININAIVGKNGDGKSTIVEIVIRLVNNYYAKHPRTQHSAFVQKLMYVEGVSAELFFQIDDSIYRLYCTKKNETIQNIADISPLRNDSGTQYVLRQVRPAASRVFESIYTLVSNYSLYAYNIFDFRNEWAYNGSDILNDETQNKIFWMHRIFHKNDGYITPLSIHPYRTSGNIDINKETLLSKQRLLYLFVKSKDEPSSFRNILGKKVIGIRLTPTNANKLYERSIKAFFLAHKNKDTSLDWALVPLRKEINSIKLQLSRKDVGTNQFHRISESIQKLSGLYIKGIQNVLERIVLGSEWSEDIQQEYHTFQSRVIQEMNTLDTVKVSRSNIQQYLSLINSLIDKLEEHEEVDHTEITKLYDYFPNYQALAALENYKSYNLSQLARLYTIFSFAVKIKSYQMNPAILYIPFNQISNKEKAQLYKIYKTLSIFETYPKYKDAARLEEQKYGVDASFEYSPKALSRLFDLLKQDIQYESHVTRKLVQTENYLRQETDIYDDEPDMNIDFRPADPSSKIKPISCISHYYGTSNVNLFHLIPPVFDYDIVLKDGESYMEFETLSSGEKQLLNNIGAIIYHLQNIDSSDSKYESVNLLLEEIELYFHPEFQRLLVNRVIEQIYGIRLKNIKNINITFVTHSPFVLSDIPKCNVLFIKDGKPDYEMQENTFGANIHGLLKNGFFLPNLPMGEFAHHKINDLFRKLNDHQYDESDIPEIKQEISLIGEPYLREQLYRLLRI